MFLSNKTASRNHFNDNTTDANDYCLNDKQIDRRQTSFAFPPEANTSISIPSQSVHPSHSNQTHIRTSSTLDPLNQIDPPYFTNYKMLSSDINATQEWEKLCNNSNLFSESQAIISQAIPTNLAAPAGWHSEILTSSPSMPHPIQTTDSTGFIENHNISNTLDTSSFDFPLTQAVVNQTVNKTPLLAKLPSTNLSSSKIDETIGAAPNFSFTENSQLITEKEQQAVIVNKPNLPPLIVHKKLPADAVTYHQNISIRYLQPPTPPPPGPIIIREVLPPAAQSGPPLKLEQRPPPPVTPPPLVIRCKPPPRPPECPSKVIEKILTPPPRPPRRTIIEEFARCPPKPADIIVERWLPYKRTDRRQIFFERDPAPPRPPKEPNLLVVHDQPRARIEKEYLHGETYRTDPQFYSQYYGSELDTWKSNALYTHLYEEAARVLQPPPQHRVPGSEQYHHSEYPPPAFNRSTYPPSLIAHVWDQMRSAPFNSPPSTYPHNYSGNQYPYPPPSYPTDHQSFHHSYNDYRAPAGYMPPTSYPPPQWNSDYPSSHSQLSSCPFSTSQLQLPSYQFLPSHSSTAPTSAPIRTIQVYSDHELQCVLANLTNGQIPAPIHLN